MSDNDRPITGGHQKQLPLNKHQSGFENASVEGMFVASGWDIINVDNQGVPRKMLGVRVKRASSKNGSLAIMLPYDRGKLFVECRAWRKEEDGC